MFLSSVLLIVTSCGINEDDEVIERVAVGGRVPAFSVEVVDNGMRSTFSTEDIYGETVIVFFNTSCEDCQRELPKFNEYYLSHRDDDGFRMVAISREEGEESVAAYWHANNLLIPYSAQSDRRIYNLFASSIIPRVYYCSAQGIVVGIMKE